MFINNPSHGLLPGAIAEVLRVLSRMTPGRTGRTIAAACRGVSVSQANVALRRLEALGVVVSKPVPPSKQYFLNSNHVMLQPLLSLVNARDEMFSWLRTKFEQLPGLMSVTLFGSVARRSDAVSSDLDLLAVFEDESEFELLSELITDLKADFLQRYGNNLGLTQLKMSELTNNIQGTSGFVSNVVREGESLWGWGLVNLLEGTNHAPPSSGGTQAS